jgi:hypothetical protein
MNSNQSLHWPSGLLHPVDPADPGEQPEIFSDDPLALSWANYRIRQTKESSLPDMKSCEVTDHDREQAQATRKYFQDRILMRMLKNKPLTPFQAELYQMLLGEIKHKHLGMLYRLPFFYQEDQQRRAVMTRFQQPSQEQLIPLKNTQMTLTALSMIVVHRKNNNRIQYWFKNQDGHGVCWSVSSPNPLQPLVRALYDRADQGGSLSIVSSIRWIEKFGCWYMVPLDPRLVF